MQKLKIDMLETEARLLTTLKTQQHSLNSEVFLEAGSARAIPRALRHARAKGSPSSATSYF